MKRFLMTCLLYFLSLNVYAVDFNLSSKIKLSLQEPLNILHSPNLLTLRYPEFIVSHETITYGKYYNDIDTTGVEIDFFYSIFNPSIRSKLIPDLIPHVIEQANVFGANEKEFHLIGDDSSLFGGFNKNKNQGFIFITTNKKVLNLLIVNGDRNAFNLLTNSIVRI